MENGRPPPRRVAYEREIRAGGSGWFSRLLAVVLGVIALATAAMLSVVLLAILFGAGTIVVGYIWWKTRELRRQARMFRFDNRTVDIDVVHELSTDDHSTNRR